MKHYFCNACSERWEADDANVCPHCGSAEIEETSSGVEFADDVISDDSYKYCTRCGAANYKNEAVCTTCNISSDFVDSYAEYENIKNNQTAEMLRTMLEAEKAKMEAETRRRVEEEVERRLAEELKKRGETQAQSVHNAQAGASTNKPSVQQLEAWYSEGKRLYDLAKREVHGDFRPAVECLKKAADCGHAPSQYLYAECLMHGRGLYKDESAAFTWYMRAANLGYAQAQLTVAGIYGRGKCGVAQDFEKAGYWYKLAAKNGIRDAVSFLKNLKN